MRHQIRNTPYARMKKGGLRKRKSNRKSVISRAKDHLPGHITRNDNVASVSWRVELLDLSITDQSYLGSITTQPTQPFTQTIEKIYQESQHLGAQLILDT